MDANMKLIMADFAKLNTKIDVLDNRVSGLEARQRLHFIRLSISLERWMIREIP